MKEIKLTGRERSVVKAIDFGSGSTGPEIVEYTKLEKGDLLDLLNGLSDVGYVEAFAADTGRPYTSHVSPDEFEAVRFEVNPSYALQLREAMKR